MTPSKGMRTDTTPEQVKCTRGGLHIGQTTPLNSTNGVQSQLQCGHPKLVRLQSSGFASP